MKESLRVVFVVVVVCCWAVMAVAGGVPQTLNYQGNLTDSLNKPVTAVKPMTFKMYTSAIGGVEFWTEPAKNVDVKNGQFSVVLGSDIAIPTDKLTGTTYIGITVDSSGSEMLPRQKLTSVAYALKAPDAIPKGVIVMWSGTVAPEGWALCDGANGTPDLREKFVMGVGGAYVIGTSGGKATHTLSLNEMPYHSHSDSGHGHGDSGHGHSDSGHNHYENPQVRANAGGNSNALLMSMGSSVWDQTESDGRQRLYTGIGDANILTGYANITTGYANITNSGGGAAYDNLPPYYVLAFIIKL